MVLDFKQILAVAITAAHTRSIQCQVLIRDALCFATTWVKSTYAFSGKLAHERRWMFCRARFVARRVVFAELGCVGVHLSEHAGSKRSLKTLIGRTFLKVGLRPLLERHSFLCTYQGTESVIWLPLLGGPQGLARQENLADKGGRE